MPQADLYFTADLDVDATALLKEIEHIIKSNDDSAGDCKGRAHQVSDYNHTHILLKLSMLPKAHRDDAYAKALGDQLADLLRSAADNAVIGVNITFDLVHYTGRSPAKT